MEDDHPEVRLPAAQFAQPLPHDGGGAHDQRGGVHPAVLQPRQVGNHLDGLAQA